MIKATVPKGAVRHVHARRAEGARGARTGAVEIREFLPAEQVDRIYLDRTYFLGPTRAVSAAYKLLAER